MSWSNLIYLVIGLGLGIGSHWLFIRSKQQSLVGAGSIDDPQAQPTIHLNPPKPQSVSSTSPEANQIPALWELKQTQLAYQQAHQISQYKAGFLARTSHELRSPLNSLIGLHQLILSDLCDDPAEERTFVAQAHSSALKLINLIDQILEVSRLEHGTTQLEIQPLSVANVLAEVYGLIHLVAANRNIRLQLSPPDPELYILADPRWLRQVLLSLLDSCLIQMEEGSIFVSTQSTPADQSLQIWLDVQMPIPKLSEPVNLIQSTHLLPESALKSNALSPGMNLLLTQNLLELMHCRLEVLPLPTAKDADSLTRMQLTIPLVIGEPETAALELEGK